MPRLTPDARSSFPALAGGIPDLCAASTRLTPEARRRFPAIGCGITKLNAAYAAVNSGIPHLFPVSRLRFPSLTAVYAAVNFGIPQLPPGSRRRCPELPAAYAAVNSGIPHLISGPRRGGCKDRRREPEISGMIPRFSQQPRHMPRFMFEVAAESREADAAVDVGTPQPRTRNLLRASGVNRGRSRG